MICPFCEKENKKSRVYPHGGMKTAMACPAYYDEEGTYHKHDRNTVTLGYSCSNGHKWRTLGNDKCPNCDFGGVYETEEIENDG